MMNIFMRRLIFVALNACFLLTSLNSFSQDEILSLEGARIRGNQELPNVLYLVPWKPPKIYSLEKPKSNLAASRPFKMLDRSSFKRLLAYHETFKSITTVNEN